MRAGRIRLAVLEQGYLLRPHGDRVPVALDQVGDADEARHERRPRSLVDLGRPADLVDAATAEHRDAVAHRQGFLLVVRDVDERDAHLALHPLQLELHLLAELEVERAKRLVEQQHLGLVDDGPGQRHALPLAAGELGRLAAAEPGQPDHLQRLAGLLAPLRLGHAPHPQAVLDVLGHGHVREQRVILEHGVDVPGVRRHLRDVLAAEFDPPGIRPLEPGDKPQQRGLSRPGRPEQGEELTGPHDEVDTGQRGHLAVPLAQAGDMDGRRRGSRITCSGGLRGARNRHHSARCTTVQPGPAMRLPVGLPSP